MSIMSAVIQSKKVYKSKKETKTPSSLAALKKEITTTPSIKKLVWEMAG